VTGDSGVQRGLQFDESDPAALAGALRGIVDYRGDVTVTLRSTGAEIVGYVFDCAGADDAPAGSPGRRLRVLPADGGPATSVALDDVAAIEVTGRDTAAGKSFETWIRKYVEKKMAGEVASIESTPLDES
jgi:hypothetical protein